VKESVKTREICAVADYHQLSPTPGPSRRCLRLSGIRFQLGDLIIDIEGQRLWHGRAATHLPKPLATAASEVVSIDALMSGVWHGPAGGSEIVSRRIKLLRAALGEDARQRRYIGGVRGRGYRVVASITRCDAHSPAGRAVGQGGPSPRRWAAILHVPRPVVLAALAGILIGVGCGIVWLALHPARPAGQSARPAPAPERLTREGLRGLFEGTVPFIGQMHPKPASG
jgi:DNA-binding winged helix-turn-helix (wHTH) protein